MMRSDWTIFFWLQVIQPWGLVGGIFNLPWLFVVMQALRPLGSHAALLALQAMALIIILKVGKSLHLSPWRMVMVVLSPPVAQCLVMGQFDGLFLSAYLLPPTLAVFVALAKPQVAICAGVIAGLRNKWAVLFGVALIISAYVVWGWPLTCLGTVSGLLGHVGGSSSAWNWAIWPWGLLLLPLFKSRRGRLALSPLLFPYAGVQSFIGPLLAIATLPGWVFVSVWAGMWVKWAQMMDMV